MSKYTAERVEVEIANYAEEAFPREEIDLERVTDMLRDYAALLRERESAKVHDLVKTGDPDASSTICDRNGEVVLAYCRRCRKGEADLGDTCESAKAGVTDEMVSIAIHGYDSASPSFHPSNKGMRAALEAVAAYLLPRAG